MPSSGRDSSKVSDVIASFSRPTPPGRLDSRRHRREVRNVLNKAIGNERAGLLLDRHPAPAGKRTYRPWHEAEGRMRRG